MLFSATFKKTLWGLTDIRLDVRFYLEGELFPPPSTEEGWGWGRRSYDLRVYKSSISIKPYQDFFLTLKNIDFY